MGDVCALAVSNYVESEMGTLWIIRKIFESNPNFSDGLVLADVW